MCCCATLRGSEKYSNRKTGGSHTSAAEQKYPVLSIDDLKALPIKEVMNKNSVIFLWATNPLLPEALDVMASWGFHYKTSLVWRKTGRLGLGYWFRGNTEYLLFGVRGNIKSFRLQETNLYESKPQKHSRKPEYYYDLIDRATKNIPDRRMLEIFATQRWPEWTSLGLEIDGRDIRDSLKEVINEQR